MEVCRGGLKKHLQRKYHLKTSTIIWKMFQAYKRKQTTTNYRKKMNAPVGKATGSGIFKHQDSAYLT